MQKRPEAKTPEPFCHFHRPWLGEEEEKEILDTLRSGWLTTGAKTHQLEKLFAEYVGCKHAIGLNSCTAGLHLALAALGIGPGDEVITTPMTFAATANVIVHQGAKPVFVDVEPETLNIDAQRIESRITEKTKAILPVHLYGHPCDMEIILGLSQKYHVAVVEDAAHAVESEYHGKKVGNIGDCTAFSFYATKNMTTGEGGMLTTNRDDLAEKIRILSLHGITADAWMRHGDNGYVHWDVLYPGYKYNMFDLQASLGIHQIKKLEPFWQRRKRWIETYNRAFKDVTEIQLLQAKDNVKHAYHLYPILIKTEDLTVDRDEILRALKESGIGVGVHFRALHLLTFYAKTFGFKRGGFPNAEDASERLISLPLYPKMEEEDVQRVIAVLKDILRRYKKKTVS
ncbi:MAG TPA: DegT/DnrJ/EryC1/StrS aminotransferase family protein [Candidatus Binatia bacterium]|nr:DegT/DnrJ/EryC1/StrS aminotransferase family protein [Candidatus Binatia bacterium]